MRYVVGIVAAVLAGLESQTGAVEDGPIRRRYQSERRSVRTS
jgi:hypothetical protein